jgi:PAS domain S-box-containing protein
MAQTPRGEDLRRSIGRAVVATLLLLGLTTGIDALRPDSNGLVGAPFMIAVLVLVVLVLFILLDRANQEQKQTGTDFLGTQLHLAGIIDSAMDAIISIDEDQRITLFNHAAETIFGYPAADVLGYSLDMLLPERFRESHGEHIRSFGTTGVSNRSMGALGTLMGQRANGEEFPIEASISQVEFGPARIYTVILRDVTQSKRAEESFRLAVESGPNAILIADQRGKIILANARTETYFGYTREELIGENIDRLVPARFRGVHATHREDFNAAPRARPLGIGRELSGLRKDNTEFPVEIGLTPLDMAAGKMVMATVVDITEREHGRARLERTIEELKRSNAELEQFAYVASHDLQEPLRMVSSYMQLLEERYRDQLDQEAKEFIDFAVDGAERMQRLIQDLLAFSRVGTRGKNPEPVESQEVLEKALHTLQLRIDENEAEVHNPALPRVLADSNQLGQVFQNLIGNALKFRGENPPRIDIAVETTGKTAQFSVSDNGIGFDDKHAERIFVIFQRLNNRTDYEGTGIGLAICKKIIERHGGRIWAKSDLGRGSTFLFTLPLAEDQAISTADGEAERENHETIEERAKRLV